MAYVFQERSSGSLLTQGANSSNGTLLDAKTHYEAVYSWRSGRSEQQKTNLTDGFTPSDGTIAGRLAARKDYIDRQVGVALGGNRVAPTHFLERDLGHEFATLKHSSKVSTNAGTYRRGTGLIYSVSNVSCRTMWHANKHNALSIGGSAGVPDVLGDYFKARGSSLTVPHVVPADHPLNQALVTKTATGHLNEMNPVQTKASVLASLLELARGDVPSLLKNLRRHYDDIQKMKVAGYGIKESGQFIGAESLNIQFGWAPIIRDVGAAISVLISIDQALFPEDDTRRRLRRVIWTGAASSTSSSAEWGTEAPLQRGVHASSLRPIAVNSVVGTSPWVVAMPTDFTDVAELSIQTTARFATGLAANAANNGYADRTLELLGYKLTPKVLWELTPWSWMLDWFANIGTVLENLSNLQLSGVILNYAYATSRWKSTATAHGRPFVVASSTGFRSFSGSFIQVEETDVKVRIPASPFGFSISNDSLSVGQLGILASLGLARMK